MSLLPENKSEEVRVVENSPVAPFWLKDKATDYGELLANAFQLELYLANSSKYKKNYAAEIKVKRVSLAELDLTAHSLETAVAQEKYIEQRKVKGNSLISRLTYQTSRSGSYSIPRATSKPTRSSKS